MAFDVVIAGGWVVDGSGSPPFRADVAVAGGRIVRVGATHPNEARQTAGSGGRVIDAGGLVVAPGFIDAHVHLDTTLLAEPEATPLLAQGVTTVVLGQDGLGFAPATSETLAYMAEYTAPFNPPYPLERLLAGEGGPGAGAEPTAGDGRMLTVDRYLGLFDGAVAVNVAYLLPHGTIRHNVVGAANRSATADELQRMVEQAEAGMAQGAVGLSTGLEYVPGMFGSTEELVALTRAARRYGGVYVSHLRNYRDRFRDAFDEAVRIGRESGIPVHVSHFNVPAVEGLPLVDAARAAGVDVTFDLYPYLAGSTVLSYFLPGWVMEGGVEAAKARLGQPEVRRRLREYFGAGSFDWGTVRLSAVEGAADAPLAGLTVPEGASRRGQDIIDFVCDLLIAERLQVGVVNRHTHRTEADVDTMVRHPAHMVGSDGIYRGTHPHPRGWGAFARMLRVYVRERGWLSLEDAVRRMTWHTARRFGLHDRGLVAPGFAADLVLFDPARVTDRSTYEMGRRPAEGIAWVAVNGVPAWEAGRPTGARAGRALRGAVGR